MKSDEIPTVIFSDVDCGNWGMILQNQNEFFFNLLRLFHQLPEPIYQEVLRLRTRPHTTPGALLIKNCPIGFYLPPTPQDGKLPLDKEMLVSKAMLCGTAQLLGQLFGYKEEKGGALIHNLCPLKESATAISNEGSLYELGLHTELAHLYPFSPHFVCLLCLRTDPRREAATLLVNVRDVCHRLSQNVLRKLCTPAFVIAPPQSFRTGPGWSNPMAVLKGPVSTMPEVTVEFNSLKGIDREAQAAFEAFKEACNHPDVLKRLYLDPGDLLIIDNRRCMHGRSPYSPGFSGGDRWLLRVSTISDLWPLRAHATPVQGIFSSEALSSALV